LALVVAALGGCATKAEVQAENGLQAFQSCDLRSASQDFANAHDLDPSRADFALAYALSTLAVLPEDSNVTTVLERLGFNGPIDTSKFWGNGGIFNKLAARDASCGSVSDAIQSAIPYPPAQTNGPSAAAALRDTTLTGNDFVAAAATLVPRLQKIASALEQGAGAMGEFDIQGGCGVGTVHVEPPELYALASLIEWVVAAVQAAEAYDWGVPATLALDDTGQVPQYVDALNAHIFHLVVHGSSSPLPGALASAQHATALLQKAIVAVQAIKARPANSLFNWPALPAGVLLDVQTLTDALNQLLATSGPQALPFFSPMLAMDGQSFFTSPVDLTGVSPPVWSAVPWTDGFGNSGFDIQTSSATGDAVLGPRFSPDPLPSGSPSYTFGLPNRWQNISGDAWSAAFDPDHRWEAAYGCSN
jgi:hypothetical protein